MDRSKFEEVARDVVHILTNLPRATVQDKQRAIVRCLERIEDASPATKLWLLDMTDAGDAESPNWEVAIGFVIRAEDEAKARIIAGLSCGFEGGAIWLDATKTNCVELPIDGPSGVVLRHYVNG